MTIPMFFCSAVADTKAEVERSTEIYNKAARTAPNVFEVGVPRRSSAKKGNISLIVCDISIIVYLHVLLQCKLWSRNFTKR
jgi:hypothetical protein